MANEEPIIIIKKKVQGGGHHGGAWKVAYADFVTAMMALFIVLWLLSSTSKKEQEQIGGYFRDPKGVASKHGTDKVDTPKEAPKDQDMAKLRLTMQHAIDQVASLNKLKNQIEMTVTDEGLRIELLENDKGTFFEVGSSKATPALVQLLQVLSGQIGKLPNNISVEGHTDAQRYSSDSGYGNWELSADRANVARRLMQTNGVRAQQVSQVRGFADQRLRRPDKPFDPSNRRVSLIVQYLPDASKTGTMKDIAAVNTPPPIAGSASVAAGPAKIQAADAARSSSPVGGTSTAANIQPASLPSKGVAGLLRLVHIQKK